MSYLATLSTMSGDTALTVVIQQINHNIPQFIQPHDKKLAVVGICTLITMESMPAEIAGNLPQIFKSLIHILEVKADSAPQEASNPQRQSMMNFLMDELSDTDLESFH